MNAGSGWSADLPLQRAINTAFPTERWREQRDVAPDSGLAEAKDDARSSSSGGEYLLIIHILIAHTVFSSRGARRLREPVKARRDTANYWTVEHL